MASLGQPLDPAAALADLGNPSASAYSLFGAKLISMGYCAVPAFPGTKVPGMIVAGAWRRMSDWTRRYRDRLPSDREVETWERAADGGICLIMGKASRGVVAVDIDTDDAVAPVTDALPYTPVKKRGAKGETLFFRNPNNVVSRAFTLIHPDGRRQRLVDMLSEGRQTVLPPTTHPDTGKPYTWTGDRELADVDPEDLPDLPADALDRIAAALAPLGYSQDRDRAPIAGKVASSDDEKSPFRLLNEHALANLDAWVPRLPLCRLRRTATGYEAVADWRPSNTGRPIDRRKLNLKISAAGIKDFGADQGYTAINLVMACKGDAETEAFGWLADATGWSSAIVHAPKPRATVVETSEVIEQEPPASAQGDIGIPISVATTLPASVPPWKAPIDPTPEDYAARIIKRHGIVSEIARWLLSVARRPQPRIAVATALAIVATCASRQMKTPTHSHLHLYLLNVARSGNGKDIAMKATKAVLAAAGLREMIAPEGVSSDVALLDHCIRAPASVMCIDEFGDYLASTKSNRAPPHIMKIRATMKKLWDGGEMSTPHARSHRSETLFDPCLTLICASTPAQFFDAIDRAQVLDGFLNRFLLFNVENDAPRGTSTGDLSDVPLRIREAVKAIADRPGGLAAARFRVAMTDQPPDEKPYVVPWSNEARQSWEEFEDKMLELSARGSDLEDFGPRSAHHAIRLATVLAIGDDPQSPSVGREHIEIGIDIARASLDDMVRSYHAHVAPTAGSDLQDKVLARLREAGGEATRREIIQPMRRSFKSKAEITAVEVLLSELGHIEVLEQKPEGGGRPSVKWRLIE